MLHVHRVTSFETVVAVCFGDSCVAEGSVRLKVWWGVHGGDCASFWSDTNQPILSLTLVGTP